MEIIIILIVIVVVFYFCYLNSKNKENFSASAFGGCTAENWDPSNGSWRGKFESHNCNDGISKEYGAVFVQGHNGEVLADGNHRREWVNYRNKR